MFGRKVFRTAALSFFAVIALFVAPALTALASETDPTADAKAVADNKVGAKRAAVQSDWSKWAPTIAAVAVVMVGVGTMRVTLIVHRRQTWLRANELELNVLQERLDKFFGPLLHMLQGVQLVAQELRSRQGDPNYRLLLALFDKDWRNSLSDGDKALVEEICEQASAIQEFLRTNIRFADPKILPYLSRAAVHFRILQRSYKSTLGGDAALFRHYVFPEQLDDVLALEVDRIRKRRADICSHPSKPPGEMPELLIPPNLALREWPNPTRVSFSPTPTAVPPIR